MNEWSIILLTITFSAFFSGMESAFISANKMQLEVEKQKNTLTAGIINIFTANPWQFIATMLIGNTIVLVVFGLSLSRFLEPSLLNFFHSGWLILLFQMIISSLIIIFIGEFLPKLFFKLNPNGLLKAFALPSLFLYILLWPITKFIYSFSKSILSKFSKKNISIENEKMAFTRHDLDFYINQPGHESLHSTPKEEETEIKLFKNVLDFTHVKVRDCMIPRAEIEAVDENCSVEELIQRFVATGFSKILIYSDSIDNIFGYVHSSKIFNNPASVKSVTNSITIVPETLSANKLLSLFSQKHKSIALVVDEFGGTSGLVTTEDILEEIFGEIEDEHDTDDLTIKQIKEDEWILSGRLEISTMNEKFSFNFPESDEYETLAGLILNKHESIPKINTIIEWDKFHFRILKASKTKIELVLMKIIVSEK